MFSGNIPIMKALNVATLLLMLICARLVWGNEQYEGMVKRATAETNDGLQIRLWVTKQIVKLDEDAILYYQISNRSRRAIYLVLESPPKIMIEGRTILIAPPMVTPVGHGEYNFSFIKIDRGKSYRGQFTIPGGKYGEERDWDIEVGFGYVTDIAGLNRRLNPGEDPARLRGLLNSRMTVTGLNGINIRTKRETGS